MVPFQEHLQKLAAAYAHITFDQQDLNFFDFFQEALGQEFGAEIDWLAQFSLISLVISSLRPSTLTDNIVQWFSSPEFKSLAARQKMGLRDRFHFWRIRRAIKNLINLSNQSDEGLEDEEDAAFELLSEQKWRYIAIFVLSGYAYAEAYATSLVNQALEVESVANNAWKTIKSLKSAFPTCPSKTDPEFSRFQELVNRDRRNALEKLDLIVRGLQLDKQIVTIEKQLQMPSVRGYFVHFLRIRNELAHDDPLKDLEDFSLNQLGDISAQLQMRWEEQKRALVVETPEIEKPMDWIDDIVKDITTVWPGIQILGLMLIGYPSLVEKLVLQ